MPAPKTAASKTTTTGKDLVSVTALAPVDYDGERQEIGDVFDVRERDLDQLLDVKAVKVNEAAAEDKAAA